MVLGNIREQCQSLKGSCEQREHEREEQEREEQECEEQGARAERAGSTSMRSGEHEHREQRSSTMRAQ